MCNNNVGYDAYSSAYLVVGNQRKAERSTHSWRYARIALNAAGMVPLPLEMYLTNSSQMNIRSAPFHKF